MDKGRLTGSYFRSMVYAAANRLSEQKKFVDSLNVFPVPDGDTGTNMSSTIMSAAREVERTKAETVSELAAAAARGSLMGARGNSGVILSQFFRGFSEGCQDHKELGPHELAAAVQKASDTVYKAVMKPVEGTMLTVGRFAAAEAEKAAASGVDVWGVVEATFCGAQKGLEKTPQLLPVLKEAGVVDAGGQGIVTILEGALSVIRDDGAPQLLAESVTDAGDDIEDVHHGGIMRIEDIKFKYCTEFIIRGNDLSVESIKDHITDAGDSMLVVGGADTVKVHIHTNDPGQVLTYCGGLGDLIEIGIHNMAEQNREAAAKREERQKKSFNEFSSSQPDTVKSEEKPRVEKELGMVAVCVGDGMAEIFRSLGVDHVVVGGQTMNPSTEDLLSAIDKCPAKSVLLLPNNKNVLFAANQAVELATKPVAVVPTRTVPQGIGAAMTFNPDAGLEANQERMIEASSLVTTGEVTYAVRSTKSGDLDINERDIIGLVEGDIKVAMGSIEEAAMQLLSMMVDEDKEIISIYYGDQVSTEDAEEFVEKVEEEFSDLEIELYNGGQPLYYYVFGVE